MSSVSGDRGIARACVYVSVVYEVHPDYVGFCGASILKQQSRGCAEAYLDLISAVLEGVEMYGSDM